MAKRKETNVMEEEIHNRIQARQENASTANVVEMLTSILEQVRQQQAQTQVTRALEGDAQEAVDIFIEIAAALNVEPVSGGIGGRSSRTTARQGRR